MPDDYIRYVLNLAVRVKIHPEACARITLHVINSDMPGLALIHLFLDCLDQFF
jgi:hypothetical protein